MPFKENGLVLETAVRTQRSRRVPKHENSLIFGILAKGDHMKKFCKPEILEIAESDICYVKSVVDHNPKLARSPIC